VSAELERAEREWKAAGAKMCRLCQQYGVLGRVLLGYEAPWDFHALRRKAAHGCAAD
jgi:hypothetical protein